MKERGTMGSTAHRTSDTNLRRCGGTTSRASQKSSLLYDYFEGRDVGPQRSVSLTTLSPSSVAVPMVTTAGKVSNNGDPVLGPRMAQLETLEAKMASIEVSLSTTPRRKKNGSIGSAAGVVPATPTPTQITGSVQVQGSVPVSQTPTPGSQPYRPTSNRDVAREMEALKNALRDKENLIQSLRVQLSNGKGSKSPSGAAPLTPSTPTWPACFLHRPLPSEKERRAAEDRLNKLRQDVENKRLTIKNLKMALERLDITDNIDVRIQQAELEYQLGREELNLLSLLEETRNVAAFLEEAERMKSSQSANTLLSCMGDTGRALMISVKLQYDPKSPQFGAGTRDDAPGLYVHWATDTCGMTKGDRVLEVNGKIVLGKGREEMQRLLAVSPDPAHIVVLRSAPEAEMAELAAQLAVERERTQSAERVADGLRADGVRLSHRISYLEDQVSELLSRADRDGTSVGSIGPQRSASANVSTVIVTSPSSNPQDVQLYQKGSQVQLVTNLPRLEAGSPTLAALRSKRDVHQDSRSAKSLDLNGGQLGAGSESPGTERHRSERKRHTNAHSALGLTRSTNSLDVFSAESPRGPVQHIRIRQSSGSQAEGLVSDSDVRRPRRKSEAPDLTSGRHYRKHHEYPATARPVPPRKPLRLSLHRAASLQSVESAPPAPVATPTPTTPTQHKAPKRNHKGEAPAIPSDAAHPHPFQSALRWAAPGSQLSQMVAFRTARSSGNLSASTTEKWC